MIDKEKARLVRDEVKRLIKEQFPNNDMQMFMLMFTDEDMFTLGHGCTGCAHRALVDWILNNQEVHNCGLTARSTKVN